MHTLTISPFLAFLDNTLSKYTQPKIEPREMIKWSTCKTTTKLPGTRQAYYITEIWSNMQYVNMCNMGLRVFSPLLKRKVQKRGKERESAYKGIKHKAENQIWTKWKAHNIGWLQSKNHLFKIIQHNSPYQDAQTAQAKTNLHKGDYKHILVQKYSPWVSYNIKELTFDVLIQQTVHK